MTIYTRINKNKLQTIIYSTLITFLQLNFFINAGAQTGNKINSGDKTDLIFENLTTKNGLSQNSIYTILQDKKGFLWFGTQSGINRYNGHEFKIFDHSAFDNTSLCHSYVNKLYEDSKGRIWACTEGGLALFNPLDETFTNYTHNDTINTSIADNFVWTILEDSRGSFWVGTKKGLCRFMPEKSKFELVGPLLDNNKSVIKNVSVLLEDKENNLWVGTRGKGVFKIELNKYETASGAKPIFVNFRTGNGDVRSIIEDAYGNIFAGTFGSGLYLFNSNENVFVSVPVNTGKFAFINSNSIRSLFQELANPDVLWLGTEEDGIILVNIKQNKFEKINNNPNLPNSLKGNMIHSFYKDRSGLIWVGANDGINILNPNANKFEHIRMAKENSSGLTGNAIGTMVEDEEGAIWIGTDGGGLNKFERNKNKFTSYMFNKNDPHSISSNRAIIAFKDHASNIWVGTYGGGLNKLDRSSGKFKKYIHSKTDSNSIGGNYITSIVEDNDGYLWIGTTEGGLNKFDPVTERFKRFLHDPDDSESLSENHIWILYIDKAGTLWAGTKNSGLNEMIDKDTGKFKRFTHDDKNKRGLNHNTVFDIFEDHSSGFWIGTSAGLNKLDRTTGEFADFQINRTLPDFSVECIMEDNHNRIWLMTGNAMVRFNPENEEIKIYDNRNGLMINDFRIWAKLKNRAGEMFVGGANGFAIFNPDSLKDNSYLPPVVIDNFERFNIDNPTGNAIKEVGMSQKDKLELSYKDNIFSFSFAALNYINPGKNQYAYKLEGFNKDWINLGYQHQITFTNIDPGSYLFRVKASNDDGLWNEEGASVGIVITPPYWATWWFRTGVILVVLLTIGSVIRNKLAAVEKHHKEQEAFARQLIETEELERRRIANELHDSLGQNLLVIKNSLLVKQQQENIEGVSLAETSDLVSQAIQEVRSISHNLRPHLLDQLGLTKTIKSLAKQMNESSGITITAEIDDLNDALEPKAEINLFRIIQESFNNIIKHSKCSQVWLKIKRGPDQLNISIKDNGIGMNTIEIKMRENYGQGFGLYGMEKRAHVFNWKYDLISGVNRGTEVKLTIPLERNL